MRGRKFYVILNVIVPLIACAVIGYLCYSILFTEPVAKYKISFMDEETVYATVESAGKEEILLPQTPEKHCTTFLGWYYDNNTWENEFDPKAFLEVPIADNITLYARWDEFEHTRGAWVVSNAASCTSTGLKSVSCSVCDVLLETQVISKTPHKASAAVVERSVAPTCITTGSYHEVVYCSTCKYKMSDTNKTSDIDPSGHCFDLSYENNRIFPETAGVYNAFSFEGICKLCSVEVLEKNISLKVNYQYDCLTGGKATYTYERCGKTFNYEQTLPKEEHILNGIPLSYLAETRIVGGVEKLCYSDTLPGVVIKAGESDSCATISKGVFLCDVCDTYVKIDVYHDHEGTWKITSNPTCNTEGERTLDCSVCKAKVKEKIPKHSYRYTVTDKRIINGVNSKNYTFYNLSGKCGSCDATDLIEHVTYNVDKQSTCLEFGSISYTSAKLPAQKFVVTAGASTHSVYNEILGKNVLASTLVNYDGSYNSSYGFIKYMAGSSRECGKTVDGYYICVDCDNLVKIPVFNVHNGEWVDSKLNPPSCTEYGQQLMQCDSCDAPIYRTIAPLGHGYTYELIPEDLNYKRFKLVRMCGRDSCTLDWDYPVDSATVSANIKISEKVEPACGTSGLYVYTYTYVDSQNGGTRYDLKFEAVIPATGKHMLDKNVSAASKQSADGKFNVDIGYIKFFAGQKIRCGQTQMAFYECYDCKQLVNVDAYKEHKGTWKTVTKATCYSVGKQTMTCSDCGKVESEIPMIPHTYVCTLEKRGEVTYTRYIKCSVAKCGYSLPEAYVLPTIDKIYKPSCMEEGKTVYKFTETIDGVQYTGYYETDFTPKTDHTLGGKLASAHLNSEGYFLSTLKGIVLHEDVDVSKTKNGDIVKGGYTCEKCGRFIADLDVKIVK